MPPLNKLKTKAQRLNGIFPLAYMGVVPVSPTNFVIETRPPTTADFKNFYIGDLWLDEGTNTPPTAANLWMLVDEQQNTATWINFGGVALVLSLVGNDGIPVAPNAMDQINVIGNLAQGLMTVGNPGTHTLTIETTGGGPIGQTITGNTGGAVQPDAVGNWFLLGTAPLTVAGNPLTHTLAISTNGTLATIYHTDSGNATPAAGILNIFGDGISITTSGAGNTVTITSSDIKTLTGNAGGAVGENPADGNVNIVGTGSITVTGNPGTHTLTISSSGGTAGGDPFTAYQTLNANYNPGTYSLGVNGGFTIVSDPSGVISPGGGGNPVIFTAPATGLYQFNMFMLVALTGGVATVSAIIVTTLFNYNIMSLQSVSTDSFAFSEVISMNAGDQLTILFSVGGNPVTVAGKSGANPIGTMISGFRVA